MTETAFILAKRRDLATGSVLLRNESVGPLVVCIDDVGRYEKALRLIAETGEHASSFDHPISRGHGREDPEGLEIVAVFLVPNQFAVSTAMLGRPPVKEGCVVDVLNDVDAHVIIVSWGSRPHSGLASRCACIVSHTDPRKTFKGMTDEMLAWQTERFTELAVDDNGWVVTVRPVQVVEIAFDGVQRSSRYPGGVALRFARVLRYRDDKGPDEADPIDAVRALIGP
jgi:hypothetical protein